MTNKNNNNSSSCISIVVFGASGDLAKKKTFPALFKVFKKDRFKQAVKIIGYARSKFEQADFKDQISINFKNDSKCLQFLDLCEYFNGQYDKTESYEELNAKLAQIESKFEHKRRIFYLAVPPSQYGSIAEYLKKSCYLESFTNQLIIEKPFGKDTLSSEELSKHISKYWKESEIYRIDHYLGKEMIKNILPFRFANFFFDSIWNRNCIDNVRITFKEPFGTEGRGGYFDEFGIIRDVAQNRNKLFLYNIDLIQLLCLFAMEKPLSLDAEHVRDKKVELLKCIEPIKQEDVVIGQYVKNNEKPGYKDDEGVENNSNTPTFSAFSLKINNDRWKGVPFIIKCGKALDEHKVEVRVQFKEVQNKIFTNVSRNELVIRLQPMEAIYLKYMNKRPGLEMNTAISELDLTYKDRFPNSEIPEAYEALMLDILDENCSNFVRYDELQLAWDIFTPILHKIDQGQIKNDTYVYGSRGPESADDFIKKQGFARDREDYDWKNSKESGKL